MHYYEKIKNRRKELNLTQSDLAGISGIGLRTIKEIESGTGNPEFKTIEKMLKILGLEIEIKIKNTKNNN